MKTKHRSIEQIVEEQVQRWQILHQKSAREEREIPVITISREPGSGGRILAESLASDLGISVFHQEMIHRMAESAKVHSSLLETLDERAMNVLEDWIASLVDAKHLWPDEYLKHLLKVVGVVGKHGRAVLVGRGANFILPPNRRFRLRIIAPRKIRIEQVAKAFSVSPTEAKRRIIRTESDRRAFIRKHFNADIDDPLNYDLVINTGTVGMDDAVGAVRSALGV